jgi:hypothetical protein
VARGINRLTGADLRRSKPGRYLDGGGLYLQVKVAKDGSINRSWLFRFAINGRDRWMGLGSLNTVSLAEARERARPCRLMVLDSSDPIDARRERRAKEAAASKRMMTFDECATAYIAAKRNEWRSQHHAATWPRTIRKYASPTIGKLPVDAIDTPLVMKVLQPLWGRIPETANRLRGRVEMILDWATVSGFRRGENPARWKGHLEHLLATPRKVKPKEHMAAMSYVGVPTFMARLRAELGPSARAFEFLVLTGARAGEVRGAPWSEDEWKTGFNAAIEVARQIINDPACESLLHKHAGVPGARELIAAALSRACPRARKKGELRELMNVLRDQRIAEAVALTCKDDAFSPTRQRDAKATSRRRESGASIVVEALRQLATDHPRARLKKLSEKSVNDIWAEHQQAYRHLLPR